MRVLVRARRSEYEAQGRNDASEAVAAWREKPLTDIGAAVRINWVV